MCGMHQQLSFCIALYCSPTALLELLMVRLVVISTNLGRFFQPVHNGSALLTQIYTFLEIDWWWSFQEDLFQQPGLRSEFEQIRDCLDKGMHDTLRILLDWCLVGLTLPKQKSKTRKVLSVFCASSWFWNCCLSSYGSWDMQLFSASCNQY